MRDAVIRPAQLEGENRLQVLALEEYVIAETPRQPGRLLQRRLDRDVVNPCLENPLDVGAGHRASLANSRRWRGGGKCLSRAAPRTAMHDQWRSDFPAGLSTMGGRLVLAFCRAFSIAASVSEGGASGSSTTRKGGRSGYFCSRSGMATLYTGVPALVRPSGAP